MAPATRPPLRLLRQLAGGLTTPALAFLLKCHSQCFAISSILQRLGGQKLGNRNLGHPPSLPECHASDGLRMR
jgi:hypothetical protein